MKYARLRITVIFQRQVLHDELVAGGFWIFDRENDLWINIWKYLKIFL